MKTVHAIGAALTMGMLAAGTWLGCSSGSSGNGGGPGGDAGKDVIAADVTGDQGQGSDTGTGGDGTSGDGTGGDGGGEAGPTPSCAQYCTTILQACGMADGGPTNTNQFYDQTNCMNTCMLWQLGTYGDNGDTVGCRQAQAVMAMSDQTKCEAAGAGGGGVCGMRCDDYCNMVMMHCTVANGADPPYASNADCLAACTGYPYDSNGQDYDPNAISTLNCLDYHLRESLSDLMGQGIDGGHCDDLSIDGGMTRGACHP